MKIIHRRLLPLLPLKDFHLQQRRNLVNVKLKWVKDRSLDFAVKGQRDLKAAHILISMISSSPNRSLPLLALSLRRTSLGLPPCVRVSSFLRRYPNIFLEESPINNGVPSFHLSPAAEELRIEEDTATSHHTGEILDNLIKLLMLTKTQTLPLHTIDQLRYDIGLPYDYPNTLLPNHLNLFEFITLPDDRVGLKVRSWDDRLAVSALQRNSSDSPQENPLGFPVRFTRGYGLKKKCVAWLQEWQRLPYTSPYSDPSHLDPRTDVSEKRNVGVFHELLHLTLRKQTERKNVSNLRKALLLPQKFTVVFERHPGIFYISKKDDTQTVVLREAYDGRQLLVKHPLVDIRERLGSMMRQGFLDRSRGLYKKSCIHNHEALVDSL